MKHEPDDVYKIRDKQTGLFKRKHLGNSWSSYGDAYYPQSVALAAMANCQNHYPDREFELVTFRLEEFS